MSADNRLSFPRLPTMLVMNLFPLIGVLFYNWSFFAIIYIYWWETVIMSIFNVMKMNKAAKPAQPNPNVKYNNIPETFEQVNNTFRLKAVYIGTRVFTLFIYLVFILVFIGMYQGKRPGQPNMGEIILFLDPFMKVGIGVIIFYYLADYLTWRIGGEWRETTVASLSAPIDGRAIVMHVVIVLGAVSTAFLGEKLFGSEAKAAPILFTSFFVLVKTAVDYFAERMKVNREKMVLEAVTPSQKKAN